MGKDVSHQIRWPSVPSNLVLSNFKEWGILWFLLLVTAGFAHYVLSLKVLKNELETYLLESL